MCCQKLVIAQKYSAKVQLYSFGPRSAPSTKTSASAEHYKGIVGAPLGNMCEKETPECKQAIDVIFDFWKKINNCVINVHCQTWVLESV